jgi:hypothetical protein
MAPRTALAGMIIVGALVAPAAAQRARPVEGGGSFNNAPIVDAGRYTDTIRPKERLYYAIEVLEGQKLKARVVIDGHLPVDAGPIRTDLRMVDPSREDIPGQQYIHQVWGPGTTKLVLTGDKVGQSASFAEPGLYYVSLSLGNGPRTQFDVDLRFTLKGTPVEPTATESPSPIEEETPDDEESPEPTPEDTEEPRSDTGSAPPAGGDDDLPIGLFAGFFVAGVLGGSAIELFRSGRARA